MTAGRQGRNLASTIYLLCGKKQRQMGLQHGADRISDGRPDGCIFLSQQRNAGNGDEEDDGQQDGILHGRGRFFRIQGLPADT